MAGLGETCSHVGALLYWLEYTVRKREEISCTSGANQWIEPKCTKQIPYLEPVNIDFTSAERTMKEGGASAISKSKLQALYLIRLKKILKGYLINV